MTTCFYCDAPSDPTVPALVAYCGPCWAEEPEGVRARMEADYRRGDTVESAVARMLAGATVIHIPAE